MTKRVVGNDLSEKLRCVENHLNTLYQLSGRYVIGVTPPVPVFSYVNVPDEYGVVLRTMFPGPGKISKGAIYIDKLEKPVTVIVEVIGPAGGSNVRFQLNKQLAMIQPNLPVDTGFRLIVSIDPVDVISGVWTSFLFEVNMKNSGQERFLLEELLKLKEQNEAENA